MKTQLLISRFDSIHNVNRREVLPCSLRNLKFDRGPKRRRYSQSATFSTRPSRRSRRQTEDGLGPGRCCGQISLRAVTTVAASRGLPTPFIHPPPLPPEPAAKLRPTVGRPLRRLPPPPPDVAAPPPQRSGRKAAGLPRRPLRTRDGPLNHRRSRGEAKGERPPAAGAVSSPEAARPAARRRGGN